MGKIEGHNVIAGVVDEVQVFGQQELPLAEASLAEHKRLTGHSPVDTNQGWICTHYDKTTGDNCMASWPPASPHEERLENAMLKALHGDRIDLIPGLEISFE